MSEKDRRAGRTVRELARVLFANARTLLLCLLIGGGLGLWKASTEQRTFRGKLDLAAGAPGPGAPFGLPDEVRLRQLVFEPQNLRLLIPGEPTGGEEVTEDELARVERSIVVSPVLSAAGDSRSVWQVVVEVPAETPALAHARLLAYADQLQKNFAAARYLLAMGIPSSLHETMTPLLSHLNASSDRPSASDDLAENIAAHSAEDEEKAFQKLSRKAAAIKVKLSALSSEIEASFDARRRLENQLHEWEEERLQALSIRGKLDSNPSTEWLLEEVGLDFSNVRELAVMLESLRRKRLLLSTEVTEANPLIRRLDRAIAATKTGLEQSLESARASFDEKAAGHASRVDVLRARIERTQARLDQLQELRDEQMLWERRSLPAGRTQASLAADPSSTPSTGLSEREVEAEESEEVLPAGRLLVAGPFVDPSPVRPRTARDVVLGCIAGMSFGILLVMLRTVSDQRIHVASDMDDLDLDLEVFGSIPRIKGEQPVRWTGESSTSNS